MNPHSFDHDELTADWPPEAGNEELARFAVALRQSLPQLPETAMARVEAAMQAELAGHTVRRRRRFIVVGTVAAVAASILVVLATSLTQSGHRPPTDPIVAQPATPVVDHYAVAPDPVPTQAQPERPLISLEPYAELIGEEQVAERQTP